tara:strand:+ start:607 stop:810 length:204 start_codon:yes stop_codon:yes gene_type:complete
MYPKYTNPPEMRGSYRLYAVRYWSENSLGETTYETFRTWQTSKEDAIAKAKRQPRFGGFISVGVIGY